MAERDAGPRGWQLRGKSCRTCERLDGVLHRTYFPQRQAGAVQIHDASPRGTRCVASQVRGQRASAVVWTETAKNPIEDIPEVPAEFSEGRVFHPETRDGHALILFWISISKTRRGHQPWIPSHRRGVGRANRPT